jgi:hypothetical protein
MKFKDSNTLIFIVFILTIHLFATIATQENFILSTATSEGNATADQGNTLADTKSEANALFTKDESLSLNQGRGGDAIIALSDSKANSITLNGDAQSRALSSANSQEKEITNDSSKTEQNSKDKILATAAAKADAATLSGNAASLAVSGSYSDNSLVYKNDNIVYTANLNSNNYLESLCHETEWDDLGIKAKSISVNQIGKIYFIGDDGYLYKYELVGKRSYKVKGEIHLRKLRYVTVGPDNSVYVINKYGDAYYLPYGDRDKNKWMKLDGCFRYFSVSRTGTMYKLGCEYDINGGYSVYRLVCNGYKLSCEKVGLNSEDNCFWFKLDQKATKIVVSPNGTLYFMDNNAYVFTYDGLQTRKVVEIKANDIAVSNDGTLFITRILDKFIYKIYDIDNLDKMECLQSAAVAIQVGPLNLPFIISENNSVYFTSKYAFN